MQAWFDRVGDVSVGSVILIILLLWAATRLLRILLRPGFWLAVLLILYLLSQVKTPHN